MLLGGQSHVARIYKFDETQSEIHLLKRSRYVSSNYHGCSAHMVNANLTGLNTETLPKKQRKCLNVDTTNNLILPKGNETSVPDETLDKVKIPLSETITMKDSTKKARYDYIVETGEPSASNLKSAALDANKSKQSIEGQHLKNIYLGLLVKKISGENLDCDYIQFMDKRAADTLYKKCEDEIDYFTGDLAKVKVFGKWFDVPRKQVAYGDIGLTYTFSGNTVPALTWPPFLRNLRDHLKSVTGIYFSFVLINRYENGDDYIGEHKDGEKDLNKLSPIASISLGQTRLFRFRHSDARGKNAKRNIEPVSVDLKHGTLLMMNYPTNQYWYHSLPKRPAIKFPRINLTFRDIKN